MVAGFGVMVMVLGFLGRWESLGILAWLGTGSLTLTSRGERLAVRLGCGFHRPSREQAAVLDPLWRRVLAVCGTPGGSVDLYVQRSDALNAYAVGGRSVAITSGILANYQEGRIDASAVEAVLAHELGHRYRNDSRLLPITSWLALPWRMFYRAVLQVSLRLMGRQPRAMLAVVVMAGFGIAMAQAERHGAWSTFLTLAALVLFGVGAPAAEAALSRASERAADTFAGEAGYGEHLARALQSLAARPPRRARLSDRLLDSHPQTDRRIEQLLGDRSENGSPCSGSTLIAA